MRRWLAILMLALLPLQFSWAAVAAYCGHESGEAAQHLGHHEHKHAGLSGTDQDSSPTDQDSPAGFDFDCGHCHGTCASMPAPVGDVSPLTQASHRVTPVEGAVRTLPQSPPERPQWLPLA
ncbi:MAG: cation efflux protein, CzcI family [Piscinibacter sp.]